MTQLRVSEAAALLGVSDDTVRRWCDSGRLAVTKDKGGRRIIDGAKLAALAQELAADQRVGQLDEGAHHRSARNSLTGLVTDVISDKVMSQVTMQCGAFRIVSLISTEAVRELDIEVGSLATAVVKATNVTIERNHS